MGHVKNGIKIIENFIEMIFWMEFLFRIISVGYVFVRGFIKWFFKLIFLIAMAIAFRQVFLQYKRLAGVHVLWLCLKEWF